jgi:FkbM family methyltransferase
MSAVQQEIVTRLRRFGARPRVLPYLAIYLAAPTVKPTVRYVLREVLGPKGPTSYRLRENGLQVWVRHREGDVVVLGEVFRRHYYEPPAELVDSLSEIHTIVDLGANIGIFGAFASSRWPKAQIVAFEPDAGNAAMHDRLILDNQLSDRWQLIRAAAGNHDGHISFVAGLNATSHAADENGSEPTVEVPIVDVLPHIAGADLLKMDIEGGEWAILTDQRFREAPPRAIVLEYHQHLCPGADPHAEVEAALSAAGLRIAMTLRHGDQGMLWAWLPS